MISISFPWPRSIRWQVWALAFPRPDEAETETCCEIQDKFDVIIDDGHETMWPKQLLVHVVHPRSTSPPVQSFSKAVCFPSWQIDTDTTSKWNARGKAKPPQSRVFSLGSPLVNDDPTSYATTCPSLKYHPNWFKLPMIKLAWFKFVSNRHQTDTRCFLIIFSTISNSCTKLCSGQN